MSASPYLTEEEIERLTRPLVQKAAIVKRLRAMGFTVKVAPTARRSSPERTTTS
jgi:hypothetical protein